MYALLLMSAAALASAQPIPAPSGAVGPLQDPSTAAAQSDEEQVNYEEQRLKPLNLDISDVSDGAELKVRAAKLKLKVPI